MLYSPAKNYTQSILEIKNVNISYLGDKTEKIGNNYLLAGSKVLLLYTEVNSRYFHFASDEGASEIIVREFTKVYKATLLPVNT